MDQQMNAMGGKGMMCGCPHHKVIPLLIILLGLTFLLKALDIFITESSAEIVWPVLVILIGFMKMTKGKCTCCASCAK